MEGLKRRFAECLNLLTRRFSLDNPGYHPWGQQHTAVVVQGIIASAMACRTDIYKREGLHGEVDGHRNDRIRSKLYQILNKLAKEYGCEILNAGADMRSPLKKRKNDEVVGGLSKVGSKKAKRE